MSNTLSMSSPSSPVFHQLAEFLANRLTEIDTVSSDRQEILANIARYIRDKRKQNQTAKLMFVCTHNSRRSQFSQVWAHVAAHFFGLNHVESYSAGTEVTAFHPNAVETLRRAGLQITIDNSHSLNPTYQVSMGETLPSLNCFSKLVDAPSNPRSHFCAIMTCSQADEACPLITGFEQRIPLLFEDPKISDGTAQQSQTYDETSQRICREMLAIMQQVAAK
jgi:arsenate reductase (thioredoxin)